MNNQALDKIIKTIISCETFEQLENVKKWIYGIFDKHKNDEYYNGQLKVVEVNLNNQYSKVK